MTTKNECTTKELSELNLLRINTIKQYYIIIEQKKARNANQLLIKRFFDFQGTKKKVSLLLLVQNEILSETETLRKF